MATPKLSRAMAVHRLIKMSQAGWPKTTLSEVARRLRLSRNTLGSFIGSGLNHYDPPIDPNRSETWVIAGSLEEAPLSMPERARHRHQVAKLQYELEAAYHQINADTDLRQGVLGLKKMELNPPEWVSEKRVIKDKGGPGVPILFASDLQWGEVISADELSGVNEYNIAIARRRYETLIRKTVELAKFHMVKPEYPGIIYMRGGDMISGDIHQELKETNEFQAIRQVKDLVETEITGIETLLGAFPEVWVVSVAGNHGRTTFKPQAKKSIETNYDTLSAWMLEMHFKAKGEKRVHFYTPSDPDAVFNVYGFTICLTHGDRIGSRGGTGFIGAAATIARGMKKVTEYYAAFGRTLDYIFVGHFHEYMELPWGFCNGSLPGLSEYARDGRFTPRAPQQLLVFLHPRRGITARWPILLEELPKKRAKYTKPVSFPSK